MEQPPPSLRSIAPFVARAREFFNKDDVISFYGISSLRIDANDGALYYAVQQAISLGADKDSKDREYVMKLLVKTEELKASLADHELFKDPEAGQAHIENLGLRVFGLAENEERAKRITKGTVTKFLAAASFLEITRQFGELSSEVSDRIKYAKLHASKIGKAFQTGQDPNDMIAELEKASTEQDGASTDLESNVRQAPTESPSLPSAPIQTDTPNALPAQTESPADSSYFTSCPQGKASVDEPEPSTAPPLDSFEGPDAGETSTASPRLPVHNLALDSPPVRPAPVGDKASLPVTAPDAEAHRPTYKVDSDAIAKAQKHARWAVSALNYDDIDTAIKEFKGALRTLGSDE